MGGREQKKPPWGGMAATTKAVITARVTCK